MWSFASNFLGKNKQFYERFSRCINPNIVSFGDKEDGVLSVIKEKIHSRVVVTWYCSLVVD
jgi:hypothetical protein